jgi:hypothetical protein
MSWIDVDALFAFTDTDTVTVTVTVTGCLVGVSGSRCLAGVVEIGD